MNNISWSAVGAENKEGIPEAINIQPQDGKAKSYQVAQIRAILIEHQLGK